MAVRTRLHNLQPKSPKFGWVRTNEARQFMQKHFGQRETALLMSVDRVDEDGVLSITLYEDRGVNTRRSVNSILVEKSEKPWS